MPNDKPLSFMVFPQLSLEIREFLYKVVLTYISRRWQAPGAVKKEKKSKKNLKKIRKKIKKIVPVPIYVFVDSEQKAEFKAKIKPCSHQLNCMKFLL